MINLIKHIWGTDMLENNRFCRVNMANIRRKLEENPGQNLNILLLRLVLVIVWPMKVFCKNADIDR